MQIFDDALREEDASRKLALISCEFSEAQLEGPGLERHSRLVGAFIEAGELAHGLADARAPARDAAMSLVQALARRCAISWSSGFAIAGPSSTPAELDACAALLPPGTRITSELGEGYAFHALYPESYLEAARALASPSSRWQVFGLRSIGTSLSAMVAIGLGAGRPVMLRPEGHPFARRIVENRALIDLRASHHAVVDEGPGLSGSSLASVAQWLGDAGVPLKQVHFFASHPHGPGARCSEAVDALWRQVHVQHADSDGAIVRTRRLDDWVAARVGPLQKPLQEISGGRWRSLQRHGDLEAPPVHPLRERRKFLAESASGRWLVKFTGLGLEGRHKFECARALAAGGFSPEPVGLCHGFMIERWRDDLSPMPARPSGALRSRLLERIADYLGFRMRAFRAPRAHGASIRTLWEMGRCNTESRLGSAAAGAWDRWRARCAPLEGLVRRIETDNRMQAWEWLAGGDVILKTDAVDHHAGLDPIGCQDVAWDIAGAAVEFGLAESEVQTLIAGCAERGRYPVYPPLVTMLRPCYLAFELGRCREAEQHCADEADKARQRALSDLYEEALRHALR